MASDHSFMGHALMARALRLAEHGMYTAHPNPRVGCVVAKGDRIVGEGWHERTGQPHAEIHALKQAGEQAKDATVYITLEPCSHFGRTPPCAEALVQAGVKKVVVAMQDPNPKVSGQGLEILQQSGIEVESGLLLAQAEALNPGFVMRMRHGRPLVRCKLAMSMDGRTAMASGESKWITGDAARQDVHRLRARSSAILTGIGTVLADDPSLNARPDDPEPASGWLQPLRIVLDANLSMPETAKILTLSGRTLVVTVCKEQEAQQRLLDAGAEILVLPGQGGSVDLPALMRHLADKEEVNEVLLETGATLSGAMLRAGLIDEMIIYMAPHLMGNTARGLFNLPGLESMEQRIPLEIKEMRAVGKDWKIVAGMGK